VRVSLDSVLEDTQRMAQKTDFGNKSTVTRLDETLTGIRDLEGDDAGRK